MPRSDSGHLVQRPRPQRVRAAQTARLSILLAGIGLCFAGRAGAQSGVLDPTFGTAGVVKTPVVSTDEFGNALALQADGRIVVAGTCQQTNDDFCLARYALNGNLDPTLGGTGRVAVGIGDEDDRASGIALQTDQKILVAGFSRQAGVDAFAVARFQTNGALDPTFDGDGKVTTAIGTLEDEASAVAVQPDGMIVAVGYSRTSANRDVAVVRYAANGSLDPTFSGDGKLTLSIASGNEEATAVAIQPDGKIVIAGYAAEGTDQDFFVARLLANGTPDPSFNGTGSNRFSFGVGNEVATALALQSNGKILVAGYARVGTVFHFAVARLTKTGVLDSTFDGDGKLTTPIGQTSRASAIALDPTGRFVVAGFARFAGNDDFAVVRYNTNGTLDTNFGGSGIETLAIGTALDKANAIAVQSDGKVVAAGSTRTGNDDDFAVVRYLIDDCGNGVVDVGEQCDGGATIDGDCCSNDCTLIAANTLCRAAADHCDIPDFCDGTSAACPDVRLPDGDGDGTCDVFDDCPVDPDPAQVDGDGDGLGDACDPCTNGVTVGKPKIRITKYTTGPGDDSFKFTGSLDFATAPVLDPIAKGARLILEDGTGDALFDIAVPPGAYTPVTHTGWTVNGASTSFSFVAKPAVGGVVDKLKFSVSSARRDLVKFNISGKKGGFATLPLAQPLHAILVIDAPTAATGECGEIDFAGPPPAPACSFNSSVSTLTCK